MKKFEDSIFAVVAEKGEYSDYTTWIAAAYFTRGEAEKFAKEQPERDAVLKAEADKRCEQWDEKKKAECPPPPYNERWYEVTREWNIKNPYPGLFWAPDSYNVVEVPIGKPGNYWPHT